TKTRRPPSRENWTSTPLRCDGLVRSPVSFGRFYLLSVLTTHSRWRLLRKSPVLLPFIQRRLSSRVCPLKCSFGLKSSGNHSLIFWLWRNTTITVEGGSPPNIARLARKKTRSSGWLLTRIYISMHCERSVRLWNIQETSFSEAGILTRPQPST